MERSQDIKQTQRTAQAVRLVIIFHVVGLIGLAVPFSRALFLQLVPYHLLLMATILFTNHDRFDIKFLLFFATIFISGFALEWVGVHTGLVFGNYSYGNILDPKLAGVPLLIGVNWFLLVYSAGTLLQQTRIKNKIVRLLAGALILVLLDIAIEPVAIKFNYWHWAGNTVPFKNYGCWFIVSLIFLFVFDKFEFKKQSIVGGVLLVSQFIFFMALLSL